MNFLEKSRNTLKNILKLGKIRPFFSQARNPSFGQKKEARDFSQEAGEDPIQQMRLTYRSGYLALFLFLATFGLWAMFSHIAGAVVASARFVSQSSLKKIQHKTGGIVAELNVKEGGRVNAGDVLLRLDDTLPKASLSIITKQMDDLLVLRARLIAERDNTDRIIFPPEILARREKTDLRNAIESERSLFQARKETLEGTRKQLSQRIKQFVAEVDGLEKQRSSIEKQIKIVGRELKNVKKLYSDKLVQLTRLTALERSMADLEGRRGEFLSEIAKTRGKISEVKLKIIQLQQEMNADVIDKLNNARTKLSALEERRIAAKDQLARVNILSPVTGYVFQLAVHTIGGVISPAEPVMLIVPSKDSLFLEAKVNPTDIDQIYPEQNVNIRIQAFNQRTTPYLKGKVFRMAADVSQDAVTGAAFYLIQVTVSSEELDRIAPLKIVSGMQAEIFIESEARTPIAYLLKPLQEQFNRAFRER